MDPRPLKQLGQHFLTDNAVADRIASLGDLRPGDAVWEIGPGKGILTEALLSYQVELTAFEIDRRMCKILIDRFGKRIDLVQTDVLKMEWDHLLRKYKPERTHFSNPGGNLDRSIKLISNIPYQITSPLLYRLEKYAAHFSRIVLMVQKELADRLCALPSVKDYGQMTIRLGLQFEISVELSVAACKFDPAPKVDSSVILMKPRENRPQINHLDLFYRLLNAVFLHRRKTLRNNLISLIGKEKTAKVDNRGIIDLKRRGETLDEQEFIALADLISDLA